MGGHFSGEEEGGEVYGWGSCEERRGYITSHADQLLAATRQPMGFTHS